MVYLWSKGRSLSMQASQRGYDLQPPLVRVLQSNRSLQDDGGLRLCPKRPGRRRCDAAGHLGGGGCHSFQSDDRLLRFLISFFASSLSSAVLMGWKTRQQVWNNRHVDQCPGIPEVTPGRAGPGYARHFHQAGIWAPHFHWLVQCMGPPEVECEFKSWSFWFAKWWRLLIFTWSFQQEENIYDGMKNKMRDEVDFISHITAVSHPSEVLTLLVK